MRSSSRFNLKVKRFRRKHGERTSVHILDFSSDFSVCPVNNDHQRILGHGRSILEIHIK